MDLLRFTRLYKHAFPADMATNDPIIDDFLRKYDELLVGSAGVRSETLEEASDHVLEHRDHLIAQGMPSNSASQQAVDAFKDYEELAEIQRKSKYQNFRKFFFLFGLMFASLMTGITLVSEQFWTLDQSALSTLLNELPKLSIMFIFHAVFYGFFMSYFFTFVLVSAKPKQAQNSESSSDLNVYSQKSSKWAALFLIVFMGAISITCLLGIFGYGFMSEFGELYNLILLILVAPTILGVRVAWNCYELNDELLTIKTMTGLSQIRRSDIIDLQALPAWHNLIKGNMGQQYSLSYKDETGQHQKQKIAISGEMHNADRLIASLQTISGENR